MFQGFLRKTGLTTLVSCKKRRVTVQGRRELARVLEWSMGTGPTGGTLGAQPPRKIMVITPSRLPENEENAPVKTDYLKKMLCQGYAKKLFMNQRDCVYVMYFKSGPYQVGLQSLE